MSRELWTAVDDFVANVIGASDPALESALRDSEAAGLPAISVLPAQGKFLHLLTRMLKARSILEIGTLGGYSTIWLARGMPEGGRLITLEADAKHAQIARLNLERAGLAKAVDLRLGQALETLPTLESEGCGPFDLVFIDADKVNTVNYFDWALKLARVGSVIIVDNVVRKGAVVDPNSADANVLGMRRFFERLENESRVSATVIQTVGSKGYDGFAIAYVLA
jgi:predicted O-methyltransferase YrrM